MTDVDLPLVGRTEKLRAMEVEPGVVIPYTVVMSAPPSGGSGETWYELLATNTLLPASRQSGFNDVSTGRYGYLGDYLEYDVFLSAGSWKLDVVLQRRNDQGRLTASVDGSAIATFDAYDTTVGSYSGTANFTIATADKHTIRFEIVVKNGASLDNYVQFIAPAQLRRVS